MENLRNIIKIYENLWFTGQKWLKSWNALVISGRDEGRMFAKFLKILTKPDDKATLMKCRKNINNLIDFLDIQIKF